MKEHEYPLELDKDTCRDVIYNLVREGQDADLTPSEVVFDNASVVDSPAGSLTSMVYKFQDLYWGCPSEDYLCGPFNSLIEAIHEEMLNVGKCTESIFWDGLDAEEVIKHLNWWTENDEPEEHEFTVNDRRVIYKIVNQCGEFHIV